MGVFSGLLSGLLGGGGGLGDLASKAMNIGSKLINRKEGESFGDALIGQLPAIAGGLGSVAKNFGGMIPGIGGIVSKIGEAVEGGAKQFEQPEETEKSETMYKTWDDVPAGARTDAGKLFELFKHRMDKHIGDPVEDFNKLHEGLGNDLYQVFDNNGFIGEPNSDGDEIDQGARRWYIQDILDKHNVRYVNSPEELLKHASNNMPVMSGLANVHSMSEPARMDRRDMDFPADSRGQWSSNWRNFKPSKMDKIDSLQEIQSDNMYAANLPSITHVNSAKPQTIEDVQPVSFRKNFMR